MRKTKIVATIGPASEAKIDDLIEAGIDVARQNFSHGTQEEHKESLEQVREHSDRIPVMMDTQGPEIRLEDVEEDTVLETGSTVELVADDIVGDSNRLPIDYPELLNRLEKGDTILVGDGDIELTVNETGDAVTCDVTFGGRVISRKSVNVPGKDVGPSGLTEKDRIDIAFGAEAEFDIVAVSFVKRPEDIESVREILDEHESDMHIIAKIEHMTAIENLEEILAISDGIMIARGDLGVEVSAADVPVLQKEMIKTCNQTGKPVITATQMLKSMTEHPRATRAEVSDVANAVMDGTDAVMLSEETAVGDYPVKSVEVMANVVERMEQHVAGHVPETVKDQSETADHAIAKSIWQVARDLDPAYIVAHTTSGHTAQNIAKYRPDTDIIAFTTSEPVKRQLNLIWGVHAHKVAVPEQVDQMIQDTTEYLADRELVEEKDLLVLSAGVPTSVSGTTNMMEIRTVADILAESGQD